jgi:peptidyl-tRNA hydrolase, PTH1 family
MKFLIAGLGNIGAEYAGTRHNVGFDVADHIAGKLGVDFSLGRLAFTAKGTHKGKQIYIIKPTTYMNLSGKSARYWLNELHIPIEHLLVIVDDIALPFGSLRLRASGSDAGHNGLKSLQAELGTTEYPRLRFGIGNDYPKGGQVAYVLGKWDKEDAASLPEKIAVASDIALSFCTAGLTNTMNLYNKK